MIFFSHHAYLIERSIWSSNHDVDKHPHTYTIPEKMVQFYFITQKNCNLNVTSIMRTDDFVSNINCDYDVAVNVSNICIWKYYQCINLIIISDKGNKNWFHFYLQTQTFLLLILLSMMNCVVHQVLKILLKITLVISLCTIFFAAATVQSIQLDVFNHDR